MKPALEPIYVAQRPFDQKNGALNILTHGVGAINVDGCRVATTENLNGGAYAEVGGRAESQSLHVGSGMNVPGKTVGREFVQPTGRHPANLLHDGSDAVRQMFPSAPGQIASSSSSSETRKNQHCYGEMKRGAPGSEMSPRRDGEDKSAARFFNAFPLDADPLFYCPKAGKQDRAGSKHPTVKPIALMRWLCRLVTPAGGTVLDPFAGSGTTGAAALSEGLNCLLIEAQDDYAADIRRRFNLGLPLDIDALIGGPADPIMELIG